jgi:DNA-directed RNA polymerase subunit RPC12/RpoP
MSPLSRDLYCVLMTRECPYCGHPLTREGSWFYSIRKYKCATCKREVPLTYRDKIRLFEKHTPPKPR